MSTGGTTNILYISEAFSSENSPDYQYVLRVNTTRPVLGISRAREQLVLAAISSYPWAPLVVGVSDQWLLSPFYCDVKDSEADLSAIVSVVADLQSMPIKHVNQQLYIDYEALWDSYRRVIVKEANDDKQQRWHLLLDTVKKAFDQLPVVANVWTHHDLHPGNVVTNGKHKILLDWEYAGIGSPWVDAYGLNQYWHVPREVLHQTLAVFAVLTPDEMETGLGLTNQWLTALDTLWREVNNIESGLGG